MSILAFFNKHNFKSVNTSREFFSFFGQCFGVAILLYIKVTLIISCILSKYALSDGCR